MVHHLKLMLSKQARHSAVFFYTKIQREVPSSRLHSRLLCTLIFALYCLALVFALVFLLTLFLPFLGFALLARALAPTGLRQLPASHDPYDPAQQAEPDTA